jgi:hypothetical protein
MEPIIINIATTEPYDKRVYRFLVIGIVFLIAGFSGFNTYYFFKNRSLRMAYEEKIKRFDQMERGDLSSASGIKGPVDDGKKARIEKEIAFINTLMFQDGFPWPQILDQIERSMPEGLLLQRIASGPDLKSLLLEGDAKHSGSVAEFMEGLKKQKSYWEADLFSLNVDSPEKDQDEAQSPIKFQISLTLNGKEIVSTEEKRRR